MQIQSSSITMSSQYLFSRQEQHQRRVTEHVIPQDTKTPQLKPDNKPSVSMLIPLSAQQISSNPKPQTAINPEQSIETIEQDISLLKLLVEAMIGEKIKTRIIEQSSDNKISNNNTPATTTQIAAPASSDDNRNIETTVVTLSDIQEYEYSSVSINANLKTADGLIIDIDMNIEMERRFQQTQLTVALQQGPLTDPLVINFNGNTIALSDQRLAFDLDSDGTLDLLPTISSNSAYLALDKNNDGIINNGSELFGPVSGNGFAELALYDEDGNGFIDSDDSIYQQLLAFNASDNATLSLQSLNINALYLNAQSSPFRLTDNANNTLGAIRSTSFYLDDQYQPGSLQQIDLNV